MSRPVKVFCWLGWNEHSSVQSVRRHRPRRRGRTSGGAAHRTRRTPPRRRTRRGRPPPARRSAAPARVAGTGGSASRSSGSGLLSGGAHFTAAVTHAPRERQPVVDRHRCRLVGEPGRCIARNSQSPDRSPVNTRPVRLAPWAAGARPEHQDPCAVGSPKPGTPRPQYSWSRKAARFSTRDLLAPRDQARATPARADVVGQARERIHGLHSRFSIEMARPQPAPPSSTLFAAGTSRPDTDHRQGAARPRRRPAPRRRRARRRPSALPSASPRSDRSTRSTPRRSSGPARPRRRSRKASGLKVHVDKGLLECDFGDWTGAS